jgi:hypothetical protein
MLSLNFRQNENMTTPESTIERYGSHFHPDAAIADIIQWKEDDEASFRLRVYGHDSAVRPFEKILREILGEPDEEGIEIAEEFGTDIWGTFSVWEDAGMHTVLCDVHGDSGCVQDIQDTICRSIARSVSSGEIQFMCERQ